MSGLNIEVNELDGFDATTLDPATMDPTQEYRWVQNRPTNISRKKLRGYRLCLRSQDKVRPLAELPQSADDLITYGDLVLMQTSKQNYQKRVLLKSRMVEERLESTKQRMREKVEKARSEGLQVELVDSYTDRGPRFPDAESEEDK